MSPEAMDLELEAISVFISFILPHLDLDHMTHNFRITVGHCFRG